MKFNSVTGLSALKKQGGYAAAKYWQARDWSHQRIISKVGNRAWSRKCLATLIPTIDDRCRNATGVDLLEVASIYKRGELEAWLASLPKG